jgi:hypothetical protein
MGSWPDPTCSPNTTLTSPVSTTMVRLPAAHPALPQTDGSVLAVDPQKQPPIPQNRIHPLDRGRFHLHDPFITQRQSTSMKMGLE